MSAIKTIVSQGGRVLIPLDMRKALGIEIGDEVLMQVENQELKIFNLDHAVKQAQELMRQYNPQKKLLSDEIIQDRRNEEK